MRLLILSDLHHEIWGDQAPLVDPSISRPDAVVLAGDINLGALAVQWAARTFAGLPVLYVHGNHEGYGLNLDEVQEEIAAACAATDNVHFLDGGEAVIGGVRFLGATLWTDFSLFGERIVKAATYAASLVMNDYRRIGIAGEGGRRLTPQDTAGIHARHKAWLSAKLDEPFDGSTVVISHMAPSIQSVSERGRDDIVAAAYATRCEELAERADLWVHGHLHTTYDYRIGKCRVVCNPCGYPREGKPQNTGFDPNLIVEI